MRLFKLNIFILISILFFASCGKSNDDQKRLSQEERKCIQKEDSLSLKIAVMPTLDCMPIYLLKEKQLYDTLKLDIRPRFFTAQMDCDTAIINKRVEGLVSDLVRTGNLRKRGIKLDYLTSTNAYWQLFSNRTARLKQLNQLGDKMIAMTRYSVTDYLTDRSMDTVKTKAKYFKIQVNNVFIRLDMLLNNEIDALWLTEPQATVARIHNNQVLRDSRDFNINFGVLAFRSDMVKDKHRKTQIKEFVKAYNKACDSLNIHGLIHYSSIMKKYFRIDARTIKALPKIKFKHIEAPRLNDIRKATNN
jgi:NitT/TauT family transport system substrate-binding protein